MRLDWVACILLLFEFANAFTVVNRPLRARSVPLTCVRLSDKKEEEGAVGGLEQDESTNDEFLMASLLARQEELEKGIGKRYITRTQKGFLNIHNDHESGPYAIDNIVGQLTEGQVVTSLQKIGDWIEHDAGGWSISKFGGFTWLEPLEE